MLEFVKRVTFAKLPTTACSCQFSDYRWPPTRYQVLIVLFLLQRALLAIKCWLNTRAWCCLPHHNRNSCYLMTFLMSQDGHSGVTRGLNQGGKV